MLPTEAATFGPASADTANVASPSDALNTPGLLNADSSRQMLPLSFCGEPVPVFQPEVARRWLRTLYDKGADPNCLYNVRKRAAVFLPIIEPILAQYGIPRDFRFVPLAESELMNDCVSPKGAAGFWQFMPQTARDYGLAVGPTVDERNNLRQSTIAACKYLRDLYRELGSWTLVAAAYNSGIGHVQGRMASQGHGNYYKLRLHAETNQYLFRILAYKELLTNPRKYRKLLPPRAVAQLTRPLPAALRGKPNADVPAFWAAAPLWGPRAVESLLEAPSALEKWFWSALNPADTNTDLTERQSGIPPINNVLAGLTVLRFRRPRFLQWQSGIGRRPVHRWEWV